MKGRWVKVQFDHDNSEKNVGFKDVTLFVEKTKRVSHKTPGEVCPKCGSHEVFHGRCDKHGIVRDEDTVWGCHACGWDNLTKNGIVNPARRAAYVATKVGGVVCLDNGDEVATRLRGMELDDVIDIAASVLGVTMTELRDQYAHLNNGQIRMNIGNRIRKAVKNDPALLVLVK